MSFQEPTAKINELREAATEWRAQFRPASYMSPATERLAAALEAFFAAPARDHAFECSPGACCDCGCCECWCHAARAVNATKEEKANG